ncbi:hypothetical protein [Streptomyces sp. NBC_01262]|uniref:hypothetical protein n=1 Tax=Streptomyces sp. NBC_01262 TaxID=2903803 RepID=UPI002E3745DF|nr:hypothetical protein [Streptomyces sp. NBC_01262]
MLRKLAPAAAVTAAVIVGGLCAAAPAQAADPGDTRAYALNGRVLCPGGVKPTAAVALELKVDEAVADSFDTKDDGTFTHATTAANSLGLAAVTLTATAPEAACGGTATKPMTVPLGVRVLGLDLLPALLGSDVTITLPAAQSVV